MESGSQIKGEMCDLGGEEGRIWLRRGELSQRQMRRAGDQTAHTLSHNMPFIAGEIALLCEDRNRAGFQDSGFRSSGDKERSELSFRSEGISSVSGFCSDKRSPSLRVFFIGRVVVYFEFKSVMVQLVPQSLFDCGHQQASMAV